MGYFKPTTPQDVVNNTGETRMELPDWYTCGCGEMGVHEWYSQHQCWFTEGDCSLGKHLPDPIDSFRVPSPMAVCSHCRCVYVEKKS